MYRVTKWLLLTLSVAAMNSSHGESISLKSQSGVLMVPVVINDKITLDFVVDSGAADVSITFDVFSTLHRTGTISSADLLPSAVYTLADGSAHKQIRFRIRTLRVGDIELHNVIGSVAPIQGDLLLGQSFLSRFRTWSVDNRRHVLLLDEMPGAPEIAQSGGAAPDTGSVAGVSPDRYAAARDRCRARSAPSDYSFCDALSAEDVARSEAVAAMAQPSGSSAVTPVARAAASAEPVVVGPESYAGARAAGVSPERFAAARARCRANAAPIDYPLCDKFTAEEIARSEAVAVK